MAPLFEHTHGVFSEVKLEKRPLIEGRPPVQCDHFLSDCLALVVSVIALIALGLLLG